MNTPRIVGRHHEVGHIDSEYSRGARAVIIVGPSGVGKTELAYAYSEAYCQDDPTHRTLKRVSLYRNTWVSAVADFVELFDAVPSNMTEREIEETVLRAADTATFVLLIDNVELNTAADVSRFIDLWVDQPRCARLLVTAQSDVADFLTEHVPRIELKGLEDPEHFGELFGVLTDTVDAETLLDVARLVEFNPQAITFLTALQPRDGDALRLAAKNLGSGLISFALDDAIEKTGLSALFFVALGVHRTSIVSETLLASLWDRLAARGAVSFVEARNMLVERRFLIPDVRERGSFRVHESVHVRLEKELLHSVGTDRVPSLHHYYAEHYRRAILSNVTVENLNLFVYHALAARNYESVYRLLIEQGIGAEGRTIPVLYLRQLTMSLLRDDIVPALSVRQHVCTLLRIAELSNDLSEHVTTLEYLGHARGLLTDDLTDALGLYRRLVYLSAVANSQLGRSSECMREFYEVAHSRPQLRDELACLSLGYLGQDLKYHDLVASIQVGSFSVAWAREVGSALLTAKNLCTLGEGMTIAGDWVGASDTFREAADLAANDNRQLGRILVNWGLSIALAGDRKSAAETIRRGCQLSAACGDRRREAQGEVFMAIVHALEQELSDSLVRLERGAEMLKAQGDGRWFVPTLDWLLYLRNEQCETYPPARRPAMSPEDATSSIGGLLDYAAEHQEFRMYHTFWLEHLHPLAVAAGFPRLEVQA